MTPKEWRHQIETLQQQADALASSATSESACRLRQSSMTPARRWRSASGSVQRRWSWRPPSPGWTAASRLCWIALAGKATRSRERRMYEHDNHRIYTADGWRGVRYADRSSGGPLPEPVRRKSCHLPAQRPPAPGECGPPSPLYSPALGSCSPAAGAVWDHASLTSLPCRLADARVCPSACARTAQSLAALQREAPKPVKALQRDGSRSNPQS
jgi:hypothetical protein